MDRPAAGAARAGAAQAGDMQQHEEHWQVGWQDTDSEGVLNDWQLADMHDEDEDEDLAQPAAAQLQAVQQLPGAAELVQQTLQQPQQLAQQQQPGAADAQAQQQQQQQRGQVADEGEGDVAAAAGPQRRRPANRFGASLLHLLGRGEQPVEHAADAEGTRRQAAEEQGEGCTRFDPNITASHQYLGDVDELEGSYGYLQEGSTARLPLLLLLDGVVLFPGCQLPLLLRLPSEQQLLERALAAPPPFTRLLAVLPGPQPWRPGVPFNVACTAEVRQVRRSEWPVAVLALGRQRAAVAQQEAVAMSQSSVLVRILSEGCQTDVPQPMRGYASAVHPALTAPWDLRLLSSRVRQLLQLVLMPLASFQGTPLQLSYYVAHNLPLPPGARQLLLTAACPAERLRLLLGLLERLDQLRCSECGALLATTADVLAMTSEGISGTFVNSHGCVHEMVSFRRVQGVQLEGHPDTAHSWFPGYAWTIAYCGTCGHHLGWRFTAVQPQLSPRVFWGLRRQRLAWSTRQGLRQQQQQQQGVLAGALVIPLGDNNRPNRPF